MVHRMAAPRIPTPAVAAAQTVVDNRSGVRSMEATSIAGPPPWHPSDDTGAGGSCLAASPGAVTDEVRRAEAGLV
jgi:hypothetical protein